MKKIILSLLLITSVGVFSQNFSTGVVVFNSNLSAHIYIDGTTNQTTLTLEGPLNAWFAVGFGGSAMSSGADVFRTDGTTITDAVTTSTSLPAADTQQDWTLVSNTESASKRTITATRANSTGDSNDFIFTAAAGTIPMIWAYGSSTTYGYHGGSNRGALAVGLVLGVSEVERLDFDMYPNPAVEELTIQLPSGSNNASVEFYNAIGSLALTKKVSQGDNRINVEGLSSGVYFVKVHTDDRVGTKKFIKK
jgi:hypothetical protein